MARAPAPTIEADDIPPLAIALEKVCWIKLKAREFHAKDVETTPDAGSNPADDNMISVLATTPEDAVEEELQAFIAALSDDEQIDLVALMWLGREDHTLADWPSIRADAARAHGRGGSTGAYVLGEPLLSDFLDEALALFGTSCEAFEAGRL